MKKNIVFVLKTTSFSFDQRIHKEANTLIQLGYSVGFIVKSGDKINKNNYPEYFFYKHFLWKINHARPRVLQYISDLYFQVKTFLLIVLNSKKINADAFWLCDPIMFPLVWMLNKLGVKIIWDHHELPPSFMLSSRILKKTFAKSYSLPDLNIHANLERKNYLEGRLEIYSKNTLIISNFPNSYETSEVRPRLLPFSFSFDTPFVYLQNSYSKDRCGNEIFAALSKIDVNVVCAGDFPIYDKLELLKIYPSLEKRIHVLGYLQQAEINWLLARCTATIILYRNTSKNQWFCDPNRLYQAILIGTPIITGSNPTILKALQASNYDRFHALPNDGSSAVDILRGVKIFLKNKFGENVANSSLPVWSEYANLIDSSLRKILGD